LCLGLFGKLDGRALVPGGPARRGVVVGLASLRPRRVHGMTRHARAVGVLILNAAAATSESAVRPGRQTARGRAYGAREHTIAPYAAWCEAPGRVGSRAYPGAHWPAYTHTHAGYLITGSADIARAGRGSCMSPQRGEA